MIDVTGSQKFNMAATKLEILHISALRWDRDVKPTAKPTLLRSGNSMSINEMLIGQTGHQKTGKIHISACGHDSRMITIARNMFLRSYKELVRLLYE